jgi:uncharacterized protein (UPF0335 family)
MLEDTQPSEEPTRDWSKVLDLDRTTLIATMVNRMEQAMREADAARDDLKEIVAECRTAEFGPRDIEAMKKIAKLRKDDKGGAAKEQLEALERIGNAVGFPLFTWALQQAS